MVTWVKNGTKFRYYETSDAWVSQTDNTIIKEDEPFAATGMGGSLVFTGTHNTHLKQYTWDGSDDIVEKSMFGDTGGQWDINWPLIVYSPLDNYFLTRGLTSSAELFRWDTGNSSIDDAFPTPYADLGGTLGYVYPAWVNDAFYIFQEDVLKDDGSGTRGNRIGEFKYTNVGNTKATEFTWLGGISVTAMASIPNGFAFINASGGIRGVHFNSNTIKTLTVNGTTAAEVTGDWKIM